MPDTYLAIRNGGKTDEEGASRLFRKLAGAQYQGVVGTTDLAVTQNGTPNMSVNIAAGDILIPYLTYLFHGWVPTTKNVTITASDPTNARWDKLVAYVDLTVVSSASSNNPDAMKFKDVTGTPSGSPAFPDDTAVQTSVGAGNPWVELQKIVVGAGVSTILTANLTDARPLFQIGGLGGIMMAANGVLSVANDISSIVITPKPGTFTNLFARVKTAPTGQALTGRVNKNGTQVATFSIAAGALNATVSGLSVTCLAGDYFTLDVTQVGSGTAGAGLTVVMG